MGLLQRYVVALFRVKHRTESETNAPLSFFPFFIEGGARGGSAFWGWIQRRNHHPGGPIPQFTH